MDKQESIEETIDTRSLKRKLFRLRVKEYMKNLNRGIHESDTVRTTDNK